MALLTQLLQSRVLRVQFAVSAAVALYSSNDGALAALAHSGDVSDLFDSLVTSMESSICNMHDVMSLELAGGNKRIKGKDGGTTAAAATAAAGGGGHKPLSKEQLTYMTATQGTALWGCAISTAKNDTVELDGGTSQRMLFLCAVSLEIAALSRAQARGNICPFTPTPSHPIPRLIRLNPP